MRKPQGYAVTTDENGNITEEDTFTCGHCNRIVFVKAKQYILTLRTCKMCMRHICKVCHGQMTCDPFEKKMERMEARDRLVRASRR